MKHVRVGIVGCGTAGQKHLEAFRSLARLDTVVGLCDKNVRLAQQTAKKFRVKAFLDHLELIESGLDLLVVATPHSTHYRLAIDALERDVALLVEKPLAPKLSQARSIADLCVKKNLKCCVGFAHRHRVELQAARGHITRQDLGRVMYLADTFWLSGGEFLPNWLWKDSEAGLGVLAYSAIHRIDWQGWLVGSKVASVYARTNRIGSHDGSINGVAVTLVFANGVVGSVVGYQPSVEVHKPFASTVIAGTEGLINIKMGLSFEIRTPEQHYRKTIHQDNPFIGQARDIVESILEDRDPCSSVQDGVHSAAVVEAIVLSAKSDSVIEVNS